MTASLDLGTVVTVMTVSATSKQQSTFFYQAFTSHRPSRILHWALNPGIFLVFLFAHFLPLTYQLSSENTETPWNYDKSNGGGTCYVRRAKRQERGATGRLKALG